MPLPLVPIAGLALRAGLVAGAAWAARRALAARRPGRTDQRAEDAMDEMDEGLALHQPADRGQTNGAARFRRTLGWGDRRVEIDAAILGRIRLRRL
jgi:hypothetical protein